MRFGILISGNMLPDFPATITIVLLFLLLSLSICSAEFLTGNRVILPIPPGNQSGFSGKAIFMETNGIFPPVRAGLSLDYHEGEEYYYCSLKVFSGGLVVWNSDEFSVFRPSERCILDFTVAGNLELKDSRGSIGWSTGTSGQGVQRLLLHKTGNLVLMTAKNHVKWQSFDFPTDILLWGQKLYNSSKLTSFSGDQRTFYSFELQLDGAALFLNSGHQKYSYWEFRPPESQSIYFSKLGSSGLNFFDKNSKISGNFTPDIPGPIKLLALAKNGNLGFYRYSKMKRKFECVYQVLMGPCNMPLTCGDYQACTLYNSCSCMPFLRPHNDLSSCISGEFSSDFCHNGSTEMVKLEGFTTILRTNSIITTSSMDICVKMCAGNCSCAAALYSYSPNSECFHYGLVGGVKQVRGERGLVYFVKAPRGIVKGCYQSSSLRPRLLIFSSVVEGVVLVMILGGFMYWFFVIRKRKKDLAGERS
ncbi:PAN domain-containing protein At5g03700 [Amborella trichopoda]|uniref:PAN domain-containing protein At5g03700 n=1 Tax=Amborella trichopoda TaxID=13333 RepID=UPI0009BFEA74|nr:PAN domain-containing protein At5g03700 [Amborella trichopoda]|eukprot:XP_020522327.1 PAN domain-containing protein At5g03700 [Amborella trichopoda]